MKVLFVPIYRLYSGIEVTVDMLIEYKSFVQNIHAQLCVKMVKGLGTKDFVVPFMG